MKNKYILGLILGIFLIGLVSAGITGYGITLNKAPVIDDNLGVASVTSVSRNSVATFEFANPTTGKTETLFGKPGQILTTSSGTRVEIATVKPGNLFRRPSAGINVLPQQASPVAGIANGTGVGTNLTNSSNTLCNICTEKYKVLEGEVQIVQGNDISIDYIDVDSTALSVNGTITSDLSEGQTFELDYGEIVTIKDVYHPGVGGQIGQVELCLSGCYKVLEGEVQIVKGDSVSIDYIDVDSTALSVNGAITSDLLEGQTFKLNNGQLVTIKDVYHPGVGGQIGQVELCLSSSY
mgnify:CR=1 FL=1